MATRALQGKSGPVLFRHLFILALLCGQARRLSLQIWYCTPVSSEINPSCLFGGVVVRFPNPLYLWLLPLLLSGQGPPLRSAQALLPGGLSFTWDPSCRPSLCLDVELK